MTDVRISAVVATRDRPELLRRALRSMVDQDASGLVEIIVVFDQAPPDSSLVGEFPQIPVKVISNDRTPGLCGARNAGIGRASGDWIAFCDDDDEWTPDKVRRQLEVMRPDSDFVVGGIVIDNGARRVTRTPGSRHLRMSRLVKSRVMEAHSSTYLIRKSALEGSLGLIDEQIPGGYYEDYDILLRAVRIRDVDVADTPVAVVHWHRSSFFKNRWEMSIDAIDYLIAKTPELLRSRPGLARLRGQQAFALAGLGRRREALRMAGQTFRLDPRQLRTYISLAVAMTPVRAEWLVRTVNAVGRGL
ncbi:MAG TPA: glycosyltransferase family 2 protein [Acidimicrobiia bacterium]|nr:glycosyltransferase family 2 protein [Acidimicrobiia bacterium]